jgi:mRNA interferase RelE/StbE
LAWKIKLTDDAKRDLRKLDKSVQKRIAAFLTDKLQATENPRATGKALQGNLSGLWRYRVGDYRILCRIEDNEWVMLNYSVCQWLNFTSNGT